MLSQPSEKKPCYHVPPTKWECICGRSPGLRCSSRDNEVAIAEKVCQTRRTFLTRLLANDYSLRVVLAAARKAAEHKLRIDHVVDVQGIDAAARQEAYDRLHAGMKVLRRALRKNRRDLRIAGDRQQPAERRKDARQLLLRRRRAAARQIQKLQFQGVLLKKPMARLSRIAVRMTDAVVQLKILDPTPANAARRREARGELRRLVRLTGESPKSLPRRLVDIRRLCREHEAACQAFMLPNLRLVVSIAKQYCHDARRPAGPDPGGKSRPHAGGRQVRPRTGTPFLDVCLLVDSANDPPLRSCSSATAFGPPT